jgi:LPS sulfotransferase NodH
MKKFFVVSSQRSGTTWFCEKIAGMFDRNIVWWEEISDESFIERKNLQHHYVDKPIIDPDKYTDILMRLEAFEIFKANKIVRKTEKFYNELYTSLNEDEFVNIMYDQCSINSILNYPVIHLIRRDSVAQAQSNFIAQKTNIYHSTDELYKEKLEYLEKNIRLNYNEIFFEAARVNLYKSIYFDTLSKYHKDCLTIFYEDCLNKDYWKNTLNKKLEKFMQDSIKNAEFETEHKKTGKMFNIINSCGNDWFKRAYHRSTEICIKNGLPANADSLTKLMYFYEK